MSRLPVALWYIIAAGIVLLLPGLAWLSWLPEKKGNFLAKLADTIGLSLSLTALAGLLAFVLGWRVSAVGLIGLYSFAGLVALTGAVCRSYYRGDDVLSCRASSPGDESPSYAIPSPLKRAEQRSSGGIGWRIGGRAICEILPFAVFALLLLWRFYQIRELVLPAWVDSLHHVLIVKVFLTTGGLPQNLEPYISIPFYYHFAFHALAAAFAFVGRVNPPQAVLWIGQVLNAAIALAVYRLGMSLWDDWRRAGLAALLVGFVSQMPAYYVTWGRYTLLAGLVLLPLAMAAALEVVRDGVTFGRLARLAVLTGGTLLAHYYAALLFALFLAFLAIQAFWRDKRAQIDADARGGLFSPPKGWGKIGALLKDHRWLALGIGALAGAVLASPWIVRMWGYAHSGVGISAVLSTEAADKAYFPNYLDYLWRMLGPKHSHFLLFLAPLGLLPAARRSQSRIFAGWAVVLSLFSIPWGVRLSPFRPDHTVIILFLPATLLVSDFFFFAAERLQEGRLAGVSKVLLAVAIGGLFIWGLRDTRAIVNPATVLAAEADLRALQWIADNTPPDARFLINVVYWQTNTYRGVDGGWWIPLLTGRGTLLPPVLYGWGEREYVSRVNELAEKASRLQTCSPEFWELVQASEVTHVYLGKNGGSLQPSALQDCAGLKLIYAAGGVSIYQIIP